MKLASIARIAAFDFGESIRSRKALALLGLYLAGSLAATGVFIRVLQSIENTAAETLQVAATERPGAMTEEVLRNERLLSILIDLVGDESLARAVVELPPMALFYGWLAFTFIPLLVTLTSCDAIASEVATGSCRFALFRVDRHSWAAGKLLGQAALMIVGILSGALGAWTLAFFFMNDADPAGTLVWLLRFSGRAAVYGFAYLGMTLGLSQVTQSVNFARGLGLLGLFFLGLGGNILESDWSTTKLLGTNLTIVQLFPQGHDLDLWRPAFTERLPGVTMLLALGLLYFVVGHLVFARRDA